MNLPSPSPAFLALLTLAASLLITPTSSAAAQRIPLAGSWRFELDRDDVGIDDAWFSRRLTSLTRLPGSLTRQGIGDPVDVHTPWTGGIVDRSWFTNAADAPHRTPGSVKIPFWLQPQTVYTGPAWYQRDIDIPRDWADRRVVLFLERPHWESRVWIDDQPVGVIDFLGTPHEHDLGTLAPGRHRLSIRIDNRRIVDIGENAHAISDHTQGNWNGIVGRIELRATPLVWIDDLQAYPDLTNRSARVHLRLGNSSGLRSVVSIECTAQPRLAPTRILSRQTLDLEIGPGGAGASLTLNLGPDARLWDEFDPFLHRITAVLRDPSGAEHRRVIPFGLREFKADSTRFTLNGRPVFLRGTLDCSAFPRTGHPPTDLDSWRNILKTIQAHGLNHLRFHSHCPPEAAFAAADELGVLLHVEAPVWANQSTTLGDGKPIDSWVLAETERILQTYGNHPSFVLMACGNEPAGTHHQAFLAEWVNHFKARDPRRLWTAAAGWPEIPANQWHSSPEPRIQAWGQGLKSRINARPPETTTDYRHLIASRNVPVVSHEIGQWCAYPDFDEIRKYTGPLKPRNFEIFRDRLTHQGLAPFARRFLTASGRLQVLCYKEDIESALRTPGMAGFQLLGLQDFPGQGTAPVGVLNAFWESKGYVTPRAFHRFAGPTVPLARLPKRIFTRADTLLADVDLAHFGPQPIPAHQARWTLRDSTGRAVARDLFPPRTTPFPIGNDTRLGQINLPLHDLPAPARYNLEVTLPNHPNAANDWDVWLYPSPSPSPTPPPPALRIVSHLDPDTAKALQLGARVLWLIPPHKVRPDPRRGPIALGFSSIFWNTAWTAGQPPHTLGILCDPAHPALAAFPTETHSDWPWWHIVTRASPMILDSLPTSLQIPIRVIDDWATARPLALALEARVGVGRIFVCSIDLDETPSLDPVRRQLRASLLSYLASNRFNPRTTVPLRQLEALANPP